MKRGRPLRFLALTLGAWTLTRAAMLWPVAGSVNTPPATGLPIDAPTVVAAPEPSIAGSEAMSSPRRTERATMVASRTDLAGGYSGGRRALFFQAAAILGPSDAASNLEVNLDDTPRPHTSSLTAEAQFAATPGLFSPPPPPSPSRLRADTWLIARPSGGDSLAFGQLGASQAGVRLTYALGDDRRIALSARASSPLRGKGSEAAVGVDWRPTSLPVHLLVEARVPLEGGRARPAAQLIGGWAGNLPLRLNAEVYAQAGVVAGRGGFADGAARVTRTLLTVGSAKVDLAAGAWGAAQRGVERLDLGPTLGVTVPVGVGAVRLSVDYRARVLGQAQPKSGPAVTLGTSF